MNKQPSVHTSIAWLGDPACHRVELVGGKAANLSRLAADHPVPPGFCLTADAFRASLNGHDSPVPRMSAPVAAELESAYARLVALCEKPVGVAVRSSAVDEDGAHDSFAGQHETFLNVMGFDGVKDAVQRCWESARSDRALAYRSSRGLAADDAPLAVLVQQLVRADVSAVVFSINPVTGNADEVVVTANWGLGESIVGGTVTPDTVILGKPDLRLVSRQVGRKERMTVRLEAGIAEVKIPRLMKTLPAITDTQAAEMARLAVELETRMGWPVDIECAYQGDRLYLLQCRPVTAGAASGRPQSKVIPVPPDFPVTWDDPGDERLFWHHDAMHKPNPVKPLEEDLGRLVDGVSRAFAHYGTPRARRLRIINGYQYSAAVPTVPPEQVAAQTERADEKLRAAALRLGELWEREWFPEIQALLAAWDRFDLCGASLPDLLAHLDETVERSSDLWYLHFRIVWPVYLAMDLFDELYHELFEDEKVFGALTLLQGFGNKTVETGHALWELSRMLLPLPETARVFRAVPAAEVLPTLAAMPDAQPFLEALKTYLDEYGQRGDLWGITSPSWIEDPTPVIGALKDYLDQQGRDPKAELAALAEARERAVSAARQRLRGYPKPVADSFELWMKAAQTAVVLSEDHGFWIDSRGDYRARRVFMELGRRFAEAGVIDRADDVFYLRLCELRETGRALPKGDRHAVVASRKAQLARLAKLHPPAALGTEQTPPPDDQRARTFDKFFGVRGLRSDDPRVLRGNAGSPGKVKGTARVLRSASEGERLRRGDVIVAATTAPSWTPLFAAAAAVVTETGGILSHAAVVAREFAIPAVVGVAGAADAIKDGQMLEVDGDTGAVRILGSD